MYKRALSAFALVVLVLAMAVTAFAASDRDNLHNDEHCYDIGSVLITQYAPTNIYDFSRKSYNTPIYFYPGGNMEKVYISVLGSASSSGTSAENVTVSNGQATEGVTCYIGTQYAINSWVYKYNLSWCTLSAFPHVFSGALEGCWYPEYYEDTVVTP